MKHLAGMFVLATVMVSVGRWIEAGGFVVLFALLFACGLGLPLPEDVPLTIAGFMVAKGTMHLSIAAVAAWCGIIGGDLVLYHLGKKFGLGITRVPFVGKHVTAARIEKAGVLFAKYGVWVVAVGRLFAGIRGAMVIAAGATRFSLVKFVIADGLAALVSGGLFIALGHWVGKNYGTLDQLVDARKKISGIEHWVLIGLLGILIIFLAYHLWRKHSRATPSQAALDKAAAGIAAEQGKR